MSEKMSLIDSDKKNKTREFNEDMKKWEKFDEQARRTEQVLHSKKKEIQTQQMKQMEEREK